MSTVHSRSTSTTGSSGRTASSSAGLSSQPGSSTSAGPSASASPIHAHDQCQIIESLAIAITNEKLQMRLPGTMGAPVVGGADVTKFSKVYKRLSSGTVTDPAAKDIISTFLYHCLKTIQDTIQMINGYPRMDWVQLKKELNGAFRHADSRVYMFMWSYFESLCMVKCEPGNVGLNVFILT